jgi:hypothetical protein
MFYFIKVSEEEKKGRYQLIMDSDSSLSNIRHLLHDLIIDTGIGKINIPHLATEDDIDRFNNSQQPFASLYTANSINDLVDKTMEHYQKEWKNLNKDDHIIIVNYENKPGELGEGSFMKDLDFHIYKNILLKKEPGIKNKLALMHIEKPDKLDYLLDILKPYCDN